MAGEIYRVQTSDGVDHLIDYMHLANRPDIDTMTADIESLKETVAYILAILSANGMDVSSGASVDGTTLSLSGTVSGRTLTIPNASVNGRTLTFGGGGSSVSDGTLSTQGSVSGRTLTVTAPTARVVDGKLNI